jgi:hypothetical protein
MNCNHEFPDLGPHIEAIARRLLGEPNRELSTRKQWRFGSRGSVSIEIVGPRQGSWYDHEAGCGGGPWQLVTLKGGMANATAVEWLKREVGVSFDGRRDQRAGAR